MRLSNEPEHILVHLPNWLGDVAMCTPALRALRRRFPRACVTLVGREAGIDLLEGLPCFDVQIPIGAQPGWTAIRRAMRQLKARPDLGIAFPHSARAALVLLAAGCRARIGYNRGGRRLLLTHTIEPPRDNGVIVPRYMAEEYLDLMRAIGCEDDGAGLELHASDLLVGQLRARLDPSRRVVGLAPGAAFGPSKRWLPERFAAVAEQLTEKSGAQCVLFTGPGEEETRDAVRNACRVPLLEPNPEGPSIAQLKSGIASLDLLIGNDSAPRHIAIAFGVPVICVMGSTSPRYTASPWERGEVLRIDVDCGPCQKPVCATDHRCMTGITADRVYLAACKALGLHRESASTS